jgi:hypothetical protein
MLNYHYYPDYDQAQGVILQTLDEKVSYLQGRMDKILITPLEEVFRIRGSNKVLWDLNISVCTLICEGISGLSSYYSGKNNGDRFKSFVEKYLYPSHPQSKKRAGLLWHGVRCTLSHGFYIRSALIETDESKHFQTGLNGKTILDLETFFNEFKTASAAFLSDVVQRTSTNLAQCFESRFDKVFPELVKNMAPIKSLKRDAGKSRRAP